ncbi:MAG: PAS domain-containing protein [Gammaproteobacteria bacterium]
MPDKNTQQQTQVDLVNPDFGVDDGRWQWDVQMNIVRATRKAFDVFGLDYRAEGYSMRQLLQAIHADDRAHVEAQITAMTLKKLHDTIIQYRIIQPDNSIRLARTYGKAIVNEEGVLTHLAGMTEDVTGKAS